MTKQERLKLVKKEREVYKRSEYFKTVVNKNPDADHAKNLYNIYNNEWGGLFEACLLLMGEDGYEETLADLRHAE